MNTRYVLWLILFAMQNVAAGPDILLGDFSQRHLDGWQQKSFKAETDYHLQTLNVLSVLTARSKAAGSGLFKEQGVELDKTPFLNWSWRIDKRLLGLNERTKNGDDYAARIYVISNGGVAFWQTKAINYVWSSNNPKDSVWPNAFVGERAMMFALRGTEAPLKVWQYEKRHVKADFQTLFGEDLHTIDGVALMTDTDNSNTEVTAYYGDIWFSKD